MSLLRKGAISQRRGGIPTFTPTGLAPKKVDDTLTQYATCNVNQRKVFYNGSYFFVIFAPHLYDGGDGKTHYTSSPDGITWKAAVDITPYRPETNIFEGYNPEIVLGIGSTTRADIAWLDKTTVDLDWYPLTISDGNLSLGSGSSLSSGGSRSHALTQNLDGNQYSSYLRSNTLRVAKNPDARGVFVACSDSGGASNGATQILPYKTSSPYDMICILKKNDNTLHYAVVGPVDPTWPEIGTITSMSLTLANGFDSFSACSEAQEADDPEKIHLVYIKSTGQLCYRKYENDAWGSERVLLASGASYPVIAAGSSGKLYVFYVADGKIWVRNYNGSKWLKTVELFTDDHTYDTPTYLSCNQNIQNGKICLVWCEGTSTPWEVWFCYLDD